MILKVGYGKALQKQIGPGLETRHIGMGTLNTWYGSPDARVRGTEVVFRRETDETYEVSQAPSDNESDASDGVTSCIETKIMAKDEVSQAPIDNESDASDGVTTCIETKIGDYIQSDESKEPELITASICHCSCQHLSFSTINSDCTEINEGEYETILRDETKEPSLLLT